MNIFYCSKCNKWEDNISNVFTTEKEKRENYTIPNLRGGYGRAITHYKCPDCGNLLAGSMLLLSDDEVDYIKHTIDFYYSQFEVTCKIEDKVVYGRDINWNITESIKKCNVYEIKNRGEVNERNN